DSWRHASNTSRTKRLLQKRGLSPSNLQKTRFPYKLEGDSPLFCNSLLTTEYRTGKVMHPTSRLGSKTAALVAALLLAGTAGAQEARPAAPAAVPQVQKRTIYNA